MSKSDFQDVVVIQRLESQSNPRLSHGPTVVLYETSRKRIEYKPFYIRRTNGTDLAIKIVAVHKAKGEEKTNKVSMNQASAQALLQILRAQKEIATKNEEGEFIVIRVKNGDAIVSDCDSSKLASAMANILRQKDVAEHLVSQELGTDLISMLRGVMRLQQLRSAIMELRRCQTIT